MPDSSSPSAAPAAPANAPPAKKHGPIRNNVEAFTVAIVMALVIKLFAFEAFQVPTESMEPTILGRTPGGDRIIVNKSTYWFREPERFDVVVFRYPLSRLVNYVKRLVGLPGETVKIVHGDIFTAADHGTDFKVARKPLAVQDAIFRSNPVIDEETMASIRSGSFWDTWQRPATGARLDDDEGELALDAGAAELVVATKFERGITPARRDRDAGDRKGRGDEEVTDPVGDLRLRVDVEPASGAKALVLQIRDGTQPNTPIRLELAIGGSAGPSRLLHGKTEIGGREFAAFRLEPGEEAEVTLENVDDRIRVVVDGDEILSHDYVQAMIAPPGGRSQASFGLTGGRAVFRFVGLWRDLHYTEFRGAPTTFDVPAGHYLFFGDNSPNSLDARAFRMVGIRLREDGKVLLGDLEAVSDDFDAPRQDNNPYFETVSSGDPATGQVQKTIKDRGVHHYRDIMGNHWRLEPGSYDVLDLTKFFDPAKPERIFDLHQSRITAPAEGQVAHAAVDSAALANLTHMPHGFVDLSVLAHFVRREDIMGRANLVFLPGGKNIIEMIRNFVRVRVIR